MGAETRRINKSLMVGWSIIAAVLFFSYTGEYIKGVRTAGYVVVFLICTILPCVYCIYRYRKNPDAENLRLYIVVGYFVMYLFSMITGSTNMVFSYILPMLSLLILYHSPRLILWTGIAAMITNVYFVVSRFLNHELNKENSKDVEIQLALIVLCFGGCYIATRIYDQITKQNIQFTAELEERNRQSQQMTFQTIRTIVNTIDAKDQYTKGHSQRVSEYSEALAKELGLSEQEVSNVRYIALLHDIGKIGVPDNILNKPGRLTNEEFTIMKMHTVVGGDILKDITSFKGLDLGAKYHHERYDGNGYPEGLKGEEIPYIARIICVADAYDAMTSTRVYRKRLSNDDVAKEIERCCGSQFDPVIGGAFLKLIRENRLADISPDSYDDDVSQDLAGQVLRKTLEAAESTLGKEELDELTRVYNKRRGEELLDIYLSNGSGCMLIIDLNGLDSINKRHGLVMGDLYLNTVAHVLSSAFEDKILYRSGGDEFVCFLGNVTDSKSLGDVLADFYARLEAQRSADEILKDLTVSIGSAMSSTAKGNKEELISKAQRALLMAKKKEGDSSFEYENIKTDKSALAKVDLDNLVNLLKEAGEFSNAYKVNYPEFVHTMNHIKELIAGKRQKISIYMLTIIEADEEQATLEQVNEVMENLNKASARTLPGNGISTQFSSFQHIVILIDMEKEERKELINNLVSSFYKLNNNRNFGLSYDEAEL